MSTMSFEFIEDTINNPNAKVQIIADNGNVNVVSWLTKQLQITELGSTWKSPFEYTTAQSLLSNAFNIISGGRMGQVKAEMPAQTIAFWQGSPRPTITADLLFVSYQRGEDPCQKILQLIKCVAPVLKGVDIPLFGRAETYFAPLEYGAGRGRTSKDSSAQGTIQLSVGKWFCARNLVAKRVSPGFSTTTSIEGFPLYATASIQFEPYMMPTYDDYCGWFKLTQVETGEKVGVGSREAGKDSPWGASGPPTLPDNIPDIPKVGGIEFGLERY